MNLVAMLYPGVDENLSLEIKWCTMVCKKNAHKYRKVSSVLPTCNPITLLVDILNSLRAFF